MIKWMLISTLMNLNVVYADKDVCTQALEQVVKHDEKAICIPAGQSEMDHKFNSMVVSMMNMVDKLNAMNNSGKEKHGLSEKDF